MNKGATHPSHCFKHCEQAAKVTDRDVTAFDHQADLVLHQSLGTVFRENVTQQRNFRIFCKEELL